MGQRRIVLTVAQHLVDVALGVRNLHVNELAVLVIHGSVDGIDEALVGGDVQALIAGEHLLVDGGINLHAVGLDELASSLVVTFALDALNLGEQFTEQDTQFLVVVDVNGDSEVNIADVTRLINIILTKSTH